MIVRLLYPKWYISGKKVLPLYPKGYTMSDLTYLAAFIKDLRKRLKLTQDELAERAGVGLRFIRDLEQGKTTLRMDKVNQVLALGGYSLAPSKELDPYHIYRNHLHQLVKISLRDHHIVEGELLEAIREGGEIAYWRFIPKNKLREYEQTKSKLLVTEIRNSDIARIENV
jgi:y4mF family transcriptional regulator